MRIAINEFGCASAGRDGPRRVRFLAAAAFVVALALSTATPSMCHAQVAGLGSAGSYGLLEDGGDVNIGSTFFFVINDPSHATSNGGVGLGNSTVDLVSGSQLTVNGTLTEGNVSFTGQGHNNVSATTLVTGAQSTLDTAWSAATAASTSYTHMASTVSGTTTSSISATGAVTVASYSYLASDLTITGNSSQIFVINVTGSHGGDAINLNNITLSGGVTAANIVFNVTGGGNIEIGDGSHSSTVNGTFLLNGSGSVSLDGTTVNGAILTQNDISTADNVVLNAAPLSVHAPELPSVAMAGVACLLILGRAGLGRFRRIRRAG